MESPSEKSKPARHWLAHSARLFILLTGDQAAVDEIRSIQPETEVAAVKEGFGRYTCLTLSATAARDLIRESARKAMQKLNTIKPYRIDGPVTFQIEHTTRNSLKIDAQYAAGAKFLRQPNHDVHRQKLSRSLDPLPHVLNSVDPEPPITART